MKWSQSSKMGAGCSTTLRPIPCRKKKENAPTPPVEVKILLLGAGDCGKSTVLKQMKLLYGDAFSPTERNEYKTIIQFNTIRNLNLMIKNMAQYNLSFQEDMKEASEFMERSESLLKNDGIDFKDWVDEGALILTPDLVKIMQNLWSNPGLRAVRTHCSEFGLSDSACVFLDKLEQIATEEYVPTNQDILLTRKKTSGLVEMFFDTMGYSFHIYDVGGQRSERRKWMHCFDDSKAVIFVAALSDFDLNLQEDSSTNRMQESLKLFKFVCQCRWLKGVAVVIFLNKTDLLRDKLRKKTSDIKDYFPQFKGDSYEFDQVVQFIWDQFALLAETRGFFTHLTCATETNNMSVVLKAVSDQIVERTLVSIGVY